MSAQPALRMITDPAALTGPQRAAIMVMYLDKPVARRILEHLPTDELQSVGLAMAEVEQVDPAVIEVVVADFVRDLHKVSMVPRTGQDFALNVLPTLIDDNRRGRVVGTLRRKLSTGFEDWIRSRPARTVATILMDEHPQTQVIALLLMGADSAARVLAFFDDQDRYELSMRMARVEQIPGELADDVEQALRAALQDHGTDRWTLNGVDMTARMLGRLEEEKMEEVLDRIADDDFDLSDKLRRRMVVFDDIARLDDRGIQALLKGIERDTLLVALRGADLTAREAFLKNMSSRAAADVRDEIEIMGPIPKAKVEAAHEEIVQAALRLRDEGLITIGGGDDMV